MINLNETTNYSIVTKEEVLKKYSEAEIFRHYIGDFRLGEPMRSPLRDNDDKPSFNIFMSNINSCLMFKDYAGERGDVIRFVQLYCGLASQQDACKKIVTDMPTPVERPRKANELEDNPKTEYRIRICTRDWTFEDIDFWVQFGISKTTLIRYNVLPISGYYHNMYYVATPDLAYAYLEYKDKDLTYKIYRPFATKANKWRNNHPFAVHQGYAQLPSGGEIMLITKSLKDVMSLVECSNIPAIGVQSETSFIKQKVMDEYAFRFTYLLTLFDNDEQGMKLAMAYEKEYNISPIFIPEAYAVKDYSDLVKRVGRFNANQIIHDLIRKNTTLANIV